MFPILISIGSFKLYTMAVFVCLAFFFGLFVMWKRGRELHYEEKELFDSIFLILIWMFVGARIAYVLVHITDYYQTILSVFAIFSRPGWYFPGGLVTAAIAIASRSKQLKWDRFQVMDLMVTGLVLAQAILSLGSFFGGIGIGSPTSSFIGVTFTGVYDKRYPVQLWESLSFGICFVFLWWVEGVYRTFSWYKRNKSQAETGYLTAMYLIWWGVTRTITLLFSTPELVFFQVRFDVLIPLVFGVVGGGWLLLVRAGMKMSDVGNGILAYFGFKTGSRGRRL